MSGTSSVTETPSSFIIFAHARSGSTSLAKALDLHSAVKIAIEPLHPNYGEWHPEERSYVQEIHDTGSLERVLTEIYSKYNGIKVLDYQLPEELYSHMLRDPTYKVIFLWRRNLLRAVVSGLIAEKTGVWQISDLNPARRESFENLAPIPEAIISEKLKYGLHLRRFYSELISQKQEHSRLSLEYETLYTDDAAANRRTLEGVFTFLGLELSEGIDFGAHLDPRRAKIVRDESYGMVPNAESINRTFGCEETGFLFE
jgi:hypothetical protein